MIAVCGKLQYSSALAGSLHGMEDYVHHQCVAIFVHYRGGPHMRSLISIDFPAPEMEPESAHVVSAVSVP